tara:strand:+ start:24 stop:161 length:138 start_codon:yes stop_codon:yes gene_type:complete
MVKKSAVLLHVVQVVAVAITALRIVEHHAAVKDAVAIIALMNVVS